ncbi:hypothetical protein Mnod_3762 [Methylobacterium nodulans ORS 2060]|uniref:Uncharacterized protein n=1 Tax=Methylobacterium nodulans (strain LMG 21967 / CNCM I-2342 / ORS 2060) TaxID=460265 RepID=B8IRC8_METNO|nr:hypothetical protein Mnod_3762 [Methylobacterium nodulans ORS 2060]
MREHARQHLAYVSSLGRHSHSETVGSFEGHDQLCIGAAAFILVVQRL